MGPVRIFVACLGNGLGEILLEREILGFETALAALTTKSKGSISLTMIRQRLTPDQREALDKLDESTLSEIIGMANDFPDGLNWVVQHFWLIHDQSKLL